MEVKGDVVLEEEEEGDLKEMEHQLKAVKDLRGKDNHLKKVAKIAHRLTLMEYGSTGETQKEKDRESQRRH